MHHHGGLNKLIFHIPQHCNAPSVLAEGRVLTAASCYRPHSTSRSLSTALLTAADVLSHHHEPEKQVSSDVIYTQSVLDGLRRSKNNIL